MQNDRYNYTEFMQRMQEAKENILYRIENAKRSFRDASYSYEYALSEGIHEDLQELEDLSDYWEIVLAELTYRYESGLYTRQFNRENYGVLDGYLIDRKLQRYQKEAANYRKLADNAGDRYLRFLRQGNDVTRVLNNLSLYTAQYEEALEHIAALTKMLRQQQ